MKFGLVAHRLHRMGPDCALLRWARVCQADILKIGMELHATGGAHDVLVVNDLLRNQVSTVGHGRDGGLMRLVSRAAGGLVPEDAIDGVFFFVDPVNPTSTFPETLALKRQCVIHGKPFVATLAGAFEWVGVEMVMAGLASNAAPQTRLLADPQSQVVALIAHDARKSEMMQFATENFGLLSRFGGRVATGTTGSRLNEIAWSQEWPPSKSWVTCYQSGPLGGDAQIAELVLDRRWAHAMSLQ